MKQISNRHQLLEKCVNALRYLGLWKIPPRASSVRLYFHLFYKLFNLLMIVGFIVALAADLLQNTDNLLIITDDGCILAGLSVILVKLIHFQIYPEKLEILMHFVDENVKLLHDKGNPEHLRIWRFHVLRETVTLNGFGTIGMCLIIALMFFTPTEPGALPIRSRYPFDVTSAPIHQVMFIYQGTVLTIAMISILAMDNMVLVLCSQIFCHFEILKRNFAEILTFEGDTKALGNSENVHRLVVNMDYEKLGIEKRNDNDYGDEKIANINFMANFLIYIKRHQEIIQFVKDLDKFSSPLLLAQLLASNVLICLTGFQAILVVGQNSGFLKFAVYLSAAFSQLFYWCWCGNELIYQSNSMAEVVWLCSWEAEKITSIKSLITIPLMRSKIPLKLTAGKFYVMSMETFISVLSGSYPFFTLLNKMNSDSEK